MYKKISIQFRTCRCGNRIIHFAGLTLIGAALECLSACSHSTHGEPRTIPSSSKAPVAVITAERRDLVHKINLPGALVALNEATLYGKVAGYVKTIRVDKGDSVRRGQTLAALEAPEMVKEVDQAQANYREALASLSRAKAQADLQAATYRRYREVHDKDPDAISKQELDEYRSKSEVADAEVNLAEARVETASANHSRLLALNQYASITAPFSGVVTDRYVDPGALIQAATSSLQGQPVVTIQNLDTIRVYVSVPEIDVPNVRKGTPASLTTAAYPGREFTASVTRYAEALDPETRTMKTEIDLANPGHLLRPGMFADVTLQLENKSGAVVVPDTALVLEGRKRFVYVVREGKAHRAEVEIGFDDGAQSEVRLGLNGGERVVVAGKENLTEGQPVEASAVAAAKL